MKILRDHFEKLISLTDAEYDYVMQFFKLRRVPKKQLLLQEGDNVSYEYFVVSGVLKAYVLDEEEKQHILQFAMEDWWTTDYLALYTGVPARVFLEAVEPTEVLCITKADKDQLCAAMHKMEHFFRIKNQHGYIGLQQRILSMLTNNAKDRYEQLLQQYPALIQRVPKHDLAAFLGVSRETLSRLYGRSKEM
ncbi:Crp/Fnr family transcriptional regulator [Chitinophaga sp. Cy-1792]|uniref:Crp/Fnr family transcriptional regulator n=1 Tax=Chitinophaga sp. Cy-1792 TaxID=2608339 RepID=UPI0014206B4E|nr:Crp/Fnr family transcriptional regulator [Chitinophaga sp. Cy-1792]NIG56387.1 Crp/Fnr family transcriptional regulator [Chitinophaga sp. Cy-1792]